MKKMHLLSMLLASSLLAPSMLLAQSSSQLSNTASQNDRAAHSSTTEDARSGSGSGFDKSAPSSPPVDLSGSKTNTPGLLRNSDGTNPYSHYEGHPIRTTKPPLPQ